MVDGLLIADATKKFVRVNKAAARMLGYSKEELLNLSVHDIHPPDQLQEVLDKFASTTGGTDSRRRELPRIVQRRPGLLRGHRGQYRSVRGKAMLIGFFRDITERKDARESLEREHDVLRELLRAEGHGPPIDSLRNP